MNFLYIWDPLNYTEYLIQLNIVLFVQSSVNLMMTIRYIKSLYRGERLWLSVVCERRNRRRTRLGPSCQSWIAVWADDPDSDSRYIGPSVHGSIKLKKDPNVVEEFGPEVNFVDLRV